MLGPAGLNMSINRGLLMKYSTVHRDGVVTEVVVPKAEFEQLTGLRVDDNLGVIQTRPNGTFAWKPSADQAKEADRILANPKPTWYSVDAMLAEVIDSGLKDLRERHGMTQQELAAALDVTQPHISKLEQDQGLEDAPLRLCRKIAEVFARQR